MNFLPALLMKPLRHEQPAMRKQRTRRRAVVIAALLALQASFVHAAQFDVSTPQEISAAAALAQPGDTIVMQDGVWADGEILFSAQGTAAQPITLRAATLGRVHLTGLSRLRLAGRHLVVDGLTFTNGYRTSGDVIAFQENSSNVANNSRLTNCAVVDYNPPNLANDTRWVSLYGVSNRVENCYLKGKANVGATLVVWVSASPNTPNHHVIAGNHFGPRPELTAASNGGETIRIGTSDVSLNTSRTVVEGNYFEQCNGDVEIVSVKSCDNIVRRNTFFECAGSVTLRHGNGTVVEGNYFFGNSKPLTGGVRIIGEDHLVFNNYFQNLAGSSSRAPLVFMQGLVSSPLNGYYQVKRATVAFNTFVNCSNTMLIGLSGTLTGTTNVTTLPPVDCVIANNIVLQGGGRIVDQRITPDNLLWEANILSGATLGIPTNSGTWRIDPALAPAPDLLWRPLSNSPALATAQGAYHFAIHDMEGDARPDLKDIGCDQFSTTAPQFPPLTPATVGPLWTRFSGTVLSWPTPAPITFGTALSGLQLNASANAAGTYTYTPPTGTILETGSNQKLTVVFTPSDQVSFNSVTQTVNIDVFKATPVITWSNPAPIVFGTVLGAAQLNASVNASGTFEFVPPPGTILNAGTAQPLTLNFTPDDTNQFLPTSRTVFIDVRRATPVITWLPIAPIEHGTPLGLAQLNASASEPGQFTYTPAANTILDAHPAQPLAVTFTPLDTTNYQSVSATNFVNVQIGGKTVPTITWANPAPLLAGSPLGALQLNATANVPGTFQYTPPAGTVLPVGFGHVLSVTFTPENSATYATISKSVTLDVGELSSNAIVRVAYLVPSNRVAQAHAVASLQHLVRFYQTWFADQMELNGYGRKTFIVETEPDGVTPFIHVLHLPQTDAYLRSDIYGARVVDAVTAAGLPVGAPGQLWWLIPEAHSQQADGAFSGTFGLGHYRPAAPADSGWAITGSDRLALFQPHFHTNSALYTSGIVPELGPFPLVQDVSFPWFEGESFSGVSSSAIGLGLRGFGEALGLFLDYRNDENFNGNLMGFGFRGIRGALYPKTYPYNYCGLSFASALALSVNPFFNQERPVLDTTAPSVTIQTSGNRTPFEGLLDITFRANDDRELHAAMLTWETDEGFVMADEQVLSGTDQIAWFSVPYFNPDRPNRYRIVVFDRAGQRASAETVINVGNSGNRSPQPFITALPRVAGLGQDIVFDATATFDAEHSINLIEIEWDLDGDGSYDTVPTTELIVTNNYYTLGSRIVRARVTDPAGAVAVSAPVAVNVTICLTTLSPLTRHHGFAGSTGAIEVTVGPKCHWNVINTNDWVQILSGASGVGSGWVGYNVLPNPTFEERRGYLTIGDDVFLVRQHPLDCNYSLSPASRYHGFGAVGNNFRVTSKANCFWEVVNTNDWITITSGSRGFATGNVHYVLAENRVFGQRTGNITVMGEVYTVTQWGTNCALALNASARTHSENAETGTVQILTASGCHWSVVNTSAWITVTSPLAGTNNGTLAYSVAANPTLIPRTASIIVGEEVFVITQQSCSYTLAPQTRSHTFLAQTGSVALTASSICPWQIINTNSWVQILGSTTGNGSKTITYTVTPNPSSEPRVATVLIGNAEFLLVQNGKPCLYTLSTDEAAFLVSGGTGSVQVRAEPNCFWSVQNVAPWLTILGGASGQSTGTVTFLVSTNDGPARFTTLVIAGQEFTVSQASAVRDIMLAPFTVAAARTNCSMLSFASQGTENQLTFSLCYDTNLLTFNSATLVSNFANATLWVSNQQASFGRVGFTLRLPAGQAMTPGLEPRLRLCFRAQNVEGRPTATLAMCDTPVPRRLTDRFGATLPAAFHDTPVDIIGLCSLADALENTVLPFSVTGSGWSCQTNTTRDGVDAAITGATPHSGESVLNSTVVGPGVLSFWWKVSSQEGSDLLRFYLNGNEQLRISGEVDWEWRTLTLPAGTHALRWRYNKNSSTTAGQDRAWLDEVIWVPNPPSITTAPVSRAVDEGSAVTFSVNVAGQPPFTYQWLHNGQALTNSADVSGARTATLTLPSVLAAQAGAYSVIVANAGGNVASAPAFLTVTPAVPLAEALDATHLNWSTTGSPAWFGQPIITLDGFDAVRSGAITHGQTTSFETTVQGPGSVSFWWKVSCETNNDRVAFFMNNTEQARISGEVEWQQRTFTLPSGNQTLRWSYTKSTSVSVGSDRAWVDRVEFKAAPVVITAHPQSQNVDPGTTTFLTVGVSGAPPFSYQWRMNGTNLLESARVRGVTTSMLTLSNVTTANAGNYSVIVVNGSAIVASSNAQVQVNTLIPLAEAVDAPDYIWTSSGSAPWVGQTTVSQDGSDAARSGRIGDSQTTAFSTTITGPGTVGWWWRVSSQTNSDQLRFYVNGTQQQFISGEVDWQWRTFNLPAGNQIIEWRYVKNASVAQGEDRGWVDQVVYVPNNTPTAPIFVSNPSHRTAVAATTASFTGAAFGSTPLSYQWLFNGAALANGAGISGVTTTNLTISGVHAGHAGFYSLQASNAAGLAQTVPAQLTVVTAPLITQPPVDRHVVAGSTATFAVTAIGQAPLSYQWLFNGTNIVNGGKFSGANTPTLSIANAQAAEQGLYSVIVSNAAGTAVSMEGAGTLTTWTAARSGAVNHNASSAIETTVTGPGTIHFAWKASSETNQDAFVFLIGAVEQARISGEVDWETRSFGVSGGAHVLRWEYSKDATGSAGLDAGYLDHVLFVPDNAMEVPSVSAHPASQTVVEGGTLFLEATVTGSQPLSYQWRRNGTALPNVGGISGAQTPKLTIPALQFAHAGAYSLFVSNAAGTALSSEAQVTVTLPVTGSLPVITAAPANQTVSENASATFNVTASSILPLAYRWHWNDTPLNDGGGISGAFTSSLNLSNVSPLQIGNYSVVVSNDSGATRASATLKVTSLGDASGTPYLAFNQAGNASWVAQSAVTHNGQSAVRSGVINDGENSRLEAYVEGPGTVSFWWRVSSEPVNDQLRFYISPNVEVARISGEVDWQQLSFPVPAGTQLLKWRYGKNASGSAGQDAGWVDDVVFVPDSISTAPFVTNQPASQTIIAGSLASFFTGVGGSMPIHFQWHSNGVPLVDGGGVSGARTARLTIESAPGQTATYMLLASNAAGSVLSDEVTLSALVPLAQPVISSQPVGRHTNEGATVTFAVNAGGAEPLSYQWQFNGAALSDGGTVSGATTALLSLQNVTAARAGNYTVEISNAAGVVTSAAAALTLSALSEVVGAPYLDFTVTGTPWQMQNGQTYVAGETNGGARLTVSTPPLITTHPITQTGIAGESAAWTVVASGSEPLTYQWRFNGINLTDGGGIIGATSPTLVRAGLQPAAAGAYSVVVGNAVGSVTSSNALLTVLSPPALVLQPVDQSIDEGGALLLTAAASGTFPLSYRWQRDGTNLFNGDGISGVTTATLSLSNALPTHSGAYTLVVSNVAGLVVSDIAYVTVFPALTLGESANAPYLQWNTAAHAPWFVQTNVTHDGEAAAQSGSIPNLSETWLETVVQGPGTIRFWWKISSQTNADTLTFYVGNVPWAQVSGDADWQKVSFPLPPGAIPLRWSYAKDSNVVSGLDRAWLDEVDFVPNNAPAVPVILTHPVGQDLAPGDTVTLSVDALGTAPLNYQWRFEGQNLGEADNVLGATTPTLRLFNIQPGQSGLYDVVVRNNYGQALSEKVMLNVLTTVPLNMALDTDHTNLFWRTGGYSPWLGQTLVTRDSLDAAQSSPVPHNSTNWIQTTVSGGPLAIAFWWKVSSQTNADRLRFLIDGREAANISGEMNWHQRSFPLSNVNSVVRWEYTKNGSGSAGLDRAWVDRVEFLHISPLVTNTAPNTNIVDQGTTIRFKVDASGSEPLRYQWRHNGTNLLESVKVIGATTSHRLILSNAQPNQTGTYICEVSNDAGSDLGEPVIVRVNPVGAIGPAVNLTPMTWETGGWSWFFSTTDDDHSGGSSARNGYVDDGHSTWMRTSLVGPGTLRFWWRASTQANADFFRFLLNGVVQGQISGNVNWQERVFTLPPGTNWVQWEYAKDLLLTNGSDRVWIDDISFVPSPPTFLVQPVSQDAEAGATVTFNPVVTGGVGMNYRWRFNGTPMNDGPNVFGSTTPILRITGMNAARAGNYSLLVTNLGGSTTSSNALLTFTTTLPLAEALDNSEYLWVTGSPGWVGQPVVHHDGVDSARNQTLSDGQSATLQTTVQGPGTVSFWWRCSSELNADFLIFYVNNVQQVTISGETGWQQRSFSVPPGASTVKWVYAKNQINKAGQDRGWVDQFTFTPLYPSVVTHPAGADVEAGTRITMSASVIGTQPHEYYWFRDTTLVENGPGVSGANSTTLVLSNAQPSQSGNYTFMVMNSAGSDVSHQAPVRITPIIPLAQALDGLGLVWTTNTTGVPWVGQQVVSHDGVDAARSGVVGNNTSNFIQTVITGPGGLNFRWRISSEPTNDRLIFTVNGVEQARISGEVPWQERTFSLGSGSQTCRWAYIKNGSVTAGQDRAWVDQVFFGPQPPTIVTQPTNQWSDVGGTVSFRVVPGGTPPFGYQWLYNGVPLVNGNGVSGVTTSNLTLTGIQLSQAGAYRVVVSNAVGTVPSAIATLTVFTDVSLAAALDTTAMSWTTNGSTTWAGHGGVTHDGVDAARSPVLGNNGSAWMQTTVTGPGTLRFHWKVSSEVNDRLRLLINGGEQASISGEVNWQVRAFNLGNGTHTLRWEYLKNASAAGGQDRGWVDEVAFGPSAPIITVQPANLTVNGGASATFNVAAVGVAPLSYRWFFNGIPLSDGSGISGTASNSLTINSAQAGLIGRYHVVVSNDLGIAVSSNAMLSLNQAVSIAEALDNNILDFTVGGTAPPFTGQQNVSFDGEDAVQNGSMVDSTYTWIKANVNGPGTLTFWWRSSTETDRDWFRLMLNAVDQVRISGETPWQQVVFPVPAGSHEIQWRYSRSPSGVGGQDRVWLDRVTYSTSGTPVSGTPPEIQIHPMSQTVDEGTTVEFDVSATGTAPLHYRWLLGTTNVLSDGGNIGGATTAGLTLFNVQLAQGGDYSVIVSNAVGAVTSLVARLTINPVLGLAEAIDQSDWTVVTQGASPWEGHTVGTHDGMDAARSGTIGDGQYTSMQTLIDGPGWLHFWWRVSSQTNSDVLAFAVNGQSAALLSGESGWQEVTHELGAGPQFIDWTYFKDASASSGEDRAWIDQVTYWPAAGFSSVPAPGPIGNIQPSIVIHEGKARLKWTAESRFTYAVYYKDNLADAEWTLLDSEVLATWATEGEEVRSEIYEAAVDDVLVGRTRFYRVVVFEQ